MRKHRVIFSKLRFVCACTARTSWEPGSSELLSCHGRLLLGVVLSVDVCRDSPTLSYAGVLAVRAVSTAILMPFGAMCVPTNYNYTSTLRPASEDS